LIIEPPKQCGFSLRLYSHQVLFYLFDKWRGNSASLSFDGMRTLSVELSEIFRAPTIKRKWIGSKLSIETDTGKRMLRIRSGDDVRLGRFSCEVEQAWRDFNIAQMHVRSGAIALVLGAIGELNESTRYPSACLLQPILSEA